LAVCHRGIPHGREGLQLVLPTLGAVATMVQPRMIVTMPLPPPSIIVIIVVVVLVLGGGIVVGSGTQGSHDTVPGSWKRSIEKKTKDEARQNEGGGGTNGPEG
jgi:hypothetical protein